MFEFQFIPLAVFKVGIDSVKFTEQENKNTTRFLSFLQHEMKWDVVFFFFFVRWRVVAVSSDWGFVDSDTKVCTNTENFFDADDIFLFTCTVSAAEVSQNLYFCGKITEALRKKNIGIHFWG